MSKMIYRMMSVVFVILIVLSCSNADENEEPEKVSYDISILRKLINLDGYRPLSVIWQTGNVVPDNGNFLVVGPTDWWLAAEIKLTEEEFSLVKKRSPRLKEFKIKNKFSKQFSLTDFVTFTHSADTFEKYSLLGGYLSFDEDNKSLFVYIATR